MSIRMECAYHPGREATNKCSLCEKSLCDECKVSKAGNFYCKTCLNKAQVKKEPTLAKPSLKPQQSQQPQQPSYPPQPPDYQQQQPYPYHQPYPYPYYYQYPQHYSYPYYQSPPPGQYPVPRKKEDTNTITVAGIMLIFVGILGLLGPIITFSLYLPSFPLFGARDITAPIWILMCFILPLIFSLFAILGGMSALQRKNYHLALIGSVFGILSWGFYIGSILSVILLIVIASSYDDFKKKKEK